mgnify:CR=1 FL=1
MASVFEKHGLHYLSPSTINLWISQPAMCLLKIAGFSDGQVGAAAWRGTAADRAITKAAFEPEISNDELITQALNVFDDRHSESTNEQDETKVTKERTAVASYVKVGADFYRSFNEPPIEDQGRVKVHIGDFNVPFIGYFDLLYKDKVRDIKTVGRAVNSLTQAASRQASIYALGTGREPWIDYVTTKEVMSYQVEQPDYWLRQIEIATKGLEHVLSFSDDTIECCQLVYPDLDHWMWGDGMKAIAKDIWNMENHDETK